MRVCQVIDKLNSGGAEKVVVDILKLLAEDVNITLFLLVSGGDFEAYIPSNVNVQKLKRKNKWNILKMKETATFIRKFDIIHVHMRHVFRYIALCDRLFNKSKSLIIFHDHYGNIEIDKKVPLFFRSVFKPKYYIGVSTFLTNWAINDLGLSKSRVFLLQNTITNTSNYFKESKSKTKKVNLVLISNIRKTKNIEFALKILMNLEDNYHLTVIGKVVDIEYYNELIEISKDSNISSRLKWINNCNNTLEIISNYDIGIHTAYSETGPLVLMEYLSIGIPFVSFNTGQVVEKVKLHFPAMVINNWELKNWVKRIEEINKEKPLPSGLTKVFNEEFSPEKYKKECLKIYQEIRNY